VWRVCAVPPERLRWPEVDGRNCESASLVRIPPDNGVVSCGRRDRPLRDVRVIRTPDCKRASSQPYSVTACGYGVPSPRIPCSKDDRAALITGDWYVTGSVLLTKNRLALREQISG